MAMWPDDRPAIPATPRRVAAEIAVCLTLAAVLLTAFLIGQARQDHWCTTHPTAAATAAACTNGPGR